MDTHQTGLQQPTKRPTIAFQWIQPTMLRQCSSSSFSLAITDRSQIQLVGRREISRGRAIVQDRKRRGTARHDRTSAVSLAGANLSAVSTRSAFKHTLGGFPGVRVHSVRPSVIKACKARLDVPISMTCILR